MRTVVTKATVLDPTLTAPDEATAAAPTLGFGTSLIGEARRQSRSAVRS